MSEAARISELIVQADPDGMELGGIAPSDGLFAVIWAESGVIFAAEIGVEVFALKRDLVCQSIFCACADGPTPADAAR